MSLTLPAQTLRNVAASLRQISYTPTSWKQLLQGHSQQICEQLEPLLVELTREGAPPRVMALLLERLADSQAALQRERDAWSFVWSGPEPLYAKTADTFATVSQLIGDAQTSLLIATYNIGLSRPFRKLLASIAERLESGQLEKVELFFHPKQIEAELGSDRLADIRKWFNEDVWTWKAKPKAYVDRRLLTGRIGDWYHHAKVVLADAGTQQARALVTSANFSEHGQRYNFEAGWLVHDPWRTRQISDHYQQMVDAGMFAEV